jgi:anti-sigma regulatory factor (Ser/Thr protein kinase)
LHEWGITGITDTAELLVSELVTNGVKAAQLLEQKPPVWLKLSTDSARLLIEVWDGNMQPPQPARLENEFPSPGNEGGRGLFLVETLSRQWSGRRRRSREARLSGVSWTCMKRLIRKQVVLPDKIHCREECQAYNR